MKHNKIITALVFVSVVMLSISCGNSRKSVSVEEGWELLGETKANFVRDRDKIDVLNSNLYTAIRFQVEKKDIHINSLEIVYQNGDKLNPVIDDDIIAGQSSREIELGPLGKSLRSIDFTYRSRGNLLKGRSTILVFGKRYRGLYNN